MKEKVLNGLRDGRTISGADLAQEFGVSRNMVWKAVERLRREGYTIGGTPRRGYRLLAVPDLIRPEEIATATGFFGRQVHYSWTIGSTNNVAKKLGMDGAPEGTVVVAERQTAGRGRLGRTWWDGGTGEIREVKEAATPPAGTSLLLSLLLRPSLPPGELVSLTLLAAVAVSRAVERTAGVSLGIKWPNDFLWRERKVAGIISEMVAEAETVAFVVLGIGINVNGRTWPTELVGKATSLLEVCGKKVDRTNLARAVLEEAERAYLAFMREGPAAIREEWLARNVTIGCRVALQTPRERVEGTAVGLGDDGSLLLKLTGGVRAFACGEVTCGREAEPAGEGHREESGERREGNPAGPERQWSRRTTLERSERDPNNTVNGEL